jgi:hypothetical protein
MSMSHSIRAYNEDVRSTLLLLASFFFIAVVIINAPPPPAPLLCRLTSVSALLFPLLSPAPLAELAGPLLVEDDNVALVVVAAVVLVAVVPKPLPSSNLCASSFRETSCNLRSNRRARSISAARCAEIISLGSLVQRTWPLLRGGLETLGVWEEDEGCEGGCCGLMLMGV